MLESSATKWRETIVSNEATLTSNTSSEREARKQMERSKREATELKATNAALTKQNEKLVAELQELADDDLRVKQIENRNK